MNRRFMGDWNDTAMELKSEIPALGTAGGDKLFNTDFEGCCISIQVWGYSVYFRLVVAILLIVALLHLVENNFFLFSMDSSKSDGMENPTPSISVDQKQIITP